MGHYYQVVSCDTTSGFLKDLFCKDITMYMDCDMSFQGPNYDKCSIDCIFSQVLALVWRPKKDTKVRKYWNWYHKGLGRFALFLAVINIYIGIHIAGGEKSMRLGYFVIFAIEIVAIIVLELLLWRRWNRQPYARSNQTNEGFQFGGTI